ncbi:MAG: ABC transporter permease subunit [Clostridiales bacterium]|jgi:nickel transport system permease protein|nr:ABC transporter permease subunit [Clostridiales bacterium]
MGAWEKLKKDRIAMISISVIALIIVTGCLAPYIAPNDPDAMNISLKYAKPSTQYLFGNDYLGRCVLSRIIYGIRPSVLLVLLAMAATIGIGTIIGLISGYTKGKVDEVFMRICDILQSFPSDVMVLAVVGIFGVGLKNILLAIILLRWPWYARVFRTAVMKYTDKNYIQFAKAIGCMT